MIPKFVVPKNKPDGSYEEKVVILHPEDWCYGVKDGVLFTNPVDGGIAECYVQSRRSMLPFSKEPKPVIAKNITFDVHGREPEKDRKAKTSDGGEIFYKGYYDARLNVMHFDAYRWVGAGFTKEKVKMVVCSPTGAAGSPPSETA